MAEKCRIPGKTSPEELLAAAHASCFSTALAGGLAKSGTPPERLEVTATVTFDKVADPMDGEAADRAGLPLSNNAALNARRSCS